jgi:hypothetical protein
VRPPHPPDDILQYSQLTNYTQLSTSSFSDSTFPHFMKIECWLPCWQKPTTCPYPVPEESNPRPAVLFL